MSDVSGAQWSPERLTELADGMRNYLGAPFAETEAALRAFARVVEMADGKQIIGVVVADEEDDTVSLADALDAGRGDG